MLGLPNLGLTKTLRDGTQAVSTTFEAANRVANTINLAAQLAETRMQFEVTKQEILNNKRLEDLQAATVSKDDEGNYTFA